MVERFSGRSIMTALIANEKRTSVRGLGEIALRVNNLDAMLKFYEEVIGLPLMARDKPARSSRLRRATTVTHRCSPCSTAPKAPAIAGRTQQPPPSITSRSRSPSLILQTN
jgi:hypothetical protein